MVVTSDPMTMTGDPARQELRIVKQSNQEQSNWILSDSVFVYKTEIKDKGPIL